MSAGADEYQRAMIMLVLLVNSPAALHPKMIKLVLGSAMTEADVFDRVAEMYQRGLLEPGETREGIGYAVSLGGLTWTLREIPRLDGPDLKLRAVMHGRGVEVDTAMRVVRERLGATLGNVAAQGNRDSST